MVSQGAVWSHLIVVLAPVLELVAYVGEREEHLLSLLKILSQQKSEQVRSQGRPAAMHRLFPVSTSWTKGRD
jgi:hypothetical protein